MNRVTFTLLASITMSAAACSNTPDATNTTLTAPTVTTPTTPANSPTTVTTPTTSSTTTTLAPTTTVFDEQALKDEIADQYVEKYFLMAEILLAPTLENLDERLAYISEPGSDSFNRRKARVEELVAIGDQLAYNDPNYYNVVVESVELVGSPPYTEAIVTACRVDNMKQITPAANSPSGVEILVGGSGRLYAFRAPEVVRLTQFGWVAQQGRIDGQLFEGASECPSAG